jgi:hypothetical protein
MLKKWAKSLVKAEVNIGKILGKHPEEGASPPVEARNICLVVY